MPTVKWNQLEDAQATLTETGWQATRSAIVKDLSGPGPSRVLIAVNSLGVRIGEPHPVLPGCRLASIEPTHESPSVVRCTLSYAPRADGDATNLPAGGAVGAGLNYTIEFGVSLQEKETALNVDGDLMIVNYIDQDGVKQNQAAIVSVLQPSRTITIHRRETTNPGEKSRRYTGTVNQKGWTLDPSADTHSWLCTGIAGTSNDSGKTWEVTYNFAHKGGIAGWLAEAQYLDPDTGRPPGDADKNETIYYPVYKTENFNDFGF